MAQHNETGKKGEELAAEWLQQNGYEILHQNWRHRHWELDIIATKNNILHFVEIKTARSVKSGYPEQWVTKAKMKLLIQAAEEYQLQNPIWKRIQFNVLAITMYEGRKTEYLFLEDVYL